jgi:hypothetical protein
MVSLADSGLAESIAQWCLPPRLQQAGKRDSFALPVHPEAMPEASAPAGTTGPNPRTSSIKMESIRRIRLYPTRAEIEDCPAQVSSGNKNPCRFASELT